MRHLLQFLERHGVVHELALVMLRRANNLTLRCTAKDPFIVCLKAMYKSTVCGNFWQFIAAVILGNFVF